MERKNSVTDGAKAFRRFLLASAAAVILTGCAAKPQSSPAAQAGEESQLQEESADKEQAAGGVSGTEETESVSGDPQSDPADASALQEAEETVTVVIPTVYENVGTQEEADEIRDKNGDESATLEEDGSLTIVMSRSQYDEMILQFRESVDKGISEILSAGDGSSIEKIEYNDDYSVFTVTVKGDEIGTIDRYAAEELIMYGTLYHIYTGNDVEHIQVDYVSRESGEVIESADSGSLINAY